MFSNINLPSSIGEFLQSMNLYLLLPPLVIFSCTIINILKQLVASGHGPNPPVVFHWFPLVGSALAYGTDPLNFMIKCREKHGDIFTFFFFWKKITVVLGPHGNEFIFGGNPAVFNAEDVYTDITTPIVGKDVAYGVPSHVFAEQKKFLKFGFTNENFRAYVGLIEEEVEMYFNTSRTFQAARGDDASQWPCFDPLRVLEEVAFLTSTRTLQGREVRSSVDVSFAALYKDLDASVILANFLLPNLPLPVNKRRDRAQKYMSEFYMDIIQNRRLGISKADSEYDLIASLLGQTYKDGRELPDHEIAHLMIGLLMAGQHTSATSGSWILLHLAANPKIAEALYAEQLEVFTSADGSLRSMTYDELKSLPLMNAVIRETLRMHPPFHSLMRHLRDDVIVPQTISPNMYVVPAGYYVLASPLVSHMDSQLWREPETWNPYRWFGSEEKGETIDTDDDTSPSFKPFQPFGSGKHRCIGEQFAYLQLGTIIATFIRQFRLHIDTGVPAINYQTMIVSPKEPRMIYYCKR